MITTSLDIRPVGDAFQVNTFETGPQDQSSFAVMANGDLVVVWRSFDEEGAFREIYGQRLTNDSEKIGEQFLISSNSDDRSDGSPVVWATDDGGFQVLWSGNQIRSYSADGTASPIFEADFRNIRDRDLASNVTEPLIPQLMRLDCRLRRSAVPNSTAAIH